MKRVICLLIIIIVAGCEKKTPTAPSKIMPADTTAPRVIAVYPPDSTLGFPINGLIGARFSEPIDTTTLTTNSFQISSNASGSIKYTDSTVRFISGPLSLITNTDYTATITTAVTDRTGNRLAEPVHWSFRTAPLDTTPPTVVSFTPPNGDQFVPANVGPTVTFSEDIYMPSLNLSTFRLIPTASGTISYKDKKATFIPSPDLKAQTLYTVLLDSIMDPAGNVMMPVLWSFKTISADRTPPQINSTFPASGAVGVAVGMPLKVYFSETLDSTTVSSATVYLSNAMGSTVCCSSNVVTVIPDRELALGQSYSLSLTTGIADRAGNHLASDYSIGFSTRSQALIPLAIGNYWVYQIGAGPDGYYIQSVDTNRIETSQIINGCRWYRDSHGNRMANLTGGLWELLGNTQPQLAVEFPADSGEMLAAPANFKVIGTSQPVIVPAGTFNCFVIANTPAYAESPSYKSSYCPNIGLVKVYNISYHPTISDGWLPDWDVHFLLSYRPNQ